MGRIKKLRMSGYIRATYTWCEQNDMTFSEICIRNYNSKTNTFDLYLRNSKKTIKMIYDGDKISRV